MEEHLLADKVSIMASTGRAGNKQPLIPSPAKYTALLLTVIVLPTQSEPHDPDDADEESVVETADYEY